jgi:hypothetical protein
MVQRELEEEQSEQNLYIFSFLWRFCPLLSSRLEAYIECCIDCATVAYLGNVFLFLKYKFS